MTNSKDYTKQLKQLKQEELRDIAKSLTEEQLKPFKTEHFKRWRQRNKDKFNASRRQHYKKYHKKTEKSNKEKSHELKGNSGKINPLDIQRF